MNSQTNRQTEKQASKQTNTETVTDIDGPELEQETVTGTDGH